MRESPLQKTPYEVGVAAGFGALTVRDNGAAAGAMGPMSLTAQRLEPRFIVGSAGPGSNGQDQRAGVAKRPPGSPAPPAAAASSCAVLGRRALRPFLSASLSGIYHLERTL